MYSDYVALYNKFKEQSNLILESDECFQEFMDVVRAGKTTLSMYRRVLEKKIDARWVEAIEGCIMSIDYVARNPRKFIKQEEEILPIELSRNITAESVRHLATHTNFISSIEGDKVTPSKILNVIKEESFETYENRFVYTLLTRLQMFINRRYDVIFEAAEDENLAILKLDSQMEAFDGEKITYKFEISTHAGESYLDTDTKNMNIFSRIDRLRRIVNEFMGSAFAQKMKSVALVRPPIMRTNAITKDPNLKNCLTLWQFVESYDEVGYVINMHDGLEQVPNAYISDLFNIAAINYAMFKSYTEKETDEKMQFSHRKKQRALKPKFIKKIVDELVDNYDLTEVEFRKIFVEELAKAKKRKADGESKIHDAVVRALALDKILKEAEQERIRKQKEAAAERSRILREKKAEKERIRRELAKDKAKIKAAKEQEKLELARLKKRKAVEKEKLALKKKKEAERLRVDNKRKKIREELEKEKAKEKVRIQKEKQKAKDNALIQKQQEKAKEKAFIQKQKEKAKEKALIQKQKEKTKEKALIQKQKEKEKGKEKTLNQKGKHKKNTHLADEQTSEPKISFSDKTDN